VEAFGSIHKRARGVGAISAIGGFGVGAHRLRLCFQLQQWSAILMLNNSHDDVCIIHVNVALLTSIVSYICS
jgi:hypothetical protein